MEDTLRARVLEDFTRRRRPWKGFRADRWYPAEWENGEGSSVVLRDGRSRAVWPREEVEIRGVPDDEWEIRSNSRLDVPIEGQTLDVPGRIAECPEGHARQIPTRFDADEVVLRCASCRRAYRLVARRS